MAATARVSKGTVQTALLCSLLVCSMAGAQAPVPVDHYGPPLCPGVHAGASRPSAEAALLEQEQGAVLDHSLVSSEPLENFSIERYRLADYADCVTPGVCYWADLDAQYRRAEAALDASLASRKVGEKLAMVLDIDETTLTNYCEMKHEDFGYILSLSTPWVLSPESSVAIPGALRLFNRAKDAHVAVFFITGRPGTPREASVKPWVDQTAATARNLKASGFDGWTGLQLRNGQENGMPTVAYKSEERQRIQGMGYKLVLSVGDQWSDLLGSPQADMNVKLPNPFYFIP